MRPTAPRTSASAEPTGIDAAMKANNLDALLFPGPSGAGIAAKPGYPTVIVPFGLVVPEERARRAGRFPAGFDAEAGAVRRQLHRHGVQRAEAHRTRLQLRTGHEEAGAARRAP